MEYPISFNIKGRNCKLKRVPKTQWVSPTTHYYPGPGLIFTTQGWTKPDTISHLKHNYSLSPILG